MYYLVVSHLHKKMLISSKHRYKLHSQGTTPLLFFDGIPIDIAVPAVILSLD